MTIEELQVDFETAIAEDPSRDQWSLAQWKAYFAEPVQVPGPLTSHEALPWLAENNRLFLLEDTAAKRTTPAAAVCALLLRKFNDPAGLVDLHEPITKRLFAKLVTEKVLTEQDLEALAQLSYRDVPKITARFGVDMLHDGDGMEVLRRMGLLPVETLAALGWLRSDTALKTLANQA